MCYDNSTSSKDARVQRALAAPKKRDEVLEMTSARKLRNLDVENISIREFRLSPSNSDGDGSTQNSSDDGNRQNALDDMRN